MSTYKEYSTLPAYLPAVYENGFCKSVEGALVWGNKTLAPPAIGEKVTITINALGAAKVVGYFSESGYLGLKVEIENPPAWFLKNTGGKTVGCVFGPEFKI